ncbi:MAG: porin [Methylomonas sp.]|nr:MAG: porin [Methylomonas sp.]
MIKTYLIFALCLMGFASRLHAEQDLAKLVMQLTHENQSLKSQLGQSHARIDELEQQLKQSVTHSEITPDPKNAAPVSVSIASQSAVSRHQAVNAPVTEGDFKGSFKVPDSNTSIGLGGFVKIDSLFSSVGMGRDKFGNQRLEVSEIPVGPVPAADNDQISFHAKESRFWFRSFTPSQWGDFNSYLELDFLGDPAAYTYTPRLRHAYGSLGHFLAGLTWSTFLNSQALADTLDNNNSAGTLLALRQPQLRWTQPFSIYSSPMEWLLALEAPKTRVWDVTRNAMTTVSSSHFPDVVARVNLNPDWGNISLAVMVRQLQSMPTALTMEKTQWSNAISLAGKINTVGPDNLRFMLGYGDALGRYDTNNFFADAIANATGEFDSLTSYSGMLAYQHWWNQSWRSSLVYGIAYADQPDTVQTANQQAQSLHANLLWSPMSRTTIGLEYIYANRELVNNQNGELQRLQLSTRFNF